MKLLIRIFIILCLSVGYTHSYAANDTNKVEFSQAELDQILAPIALYPDTILSQVLIAATYPIEIVQADRWVKNNPAVKGADAVKMVDNKDWDPSVKSLVAFPDVLDKMSDDIDWTQRVGDAFLGDEDRVMDSIQHLRKQAYSSGSLGKVEHLRVQRDDDQIIIEPAEERVVYVPVYDTRVVYGNWWWPEYPPVYWRYPSSYVFASGFYWGPSVYIGPTFFYSSCQWRERRVVVVDRFDAHRPGPVFYSGLSIVHYSGAHEWHHDPIHRRGVAYYNNDLRTHYGSRHESYQDSHVYREEHWRDDHRQSVPPKQTRFDNEHPGNIRVPQQTGVNFGMPEHGNLNPSIDRGEQVRERINHQSGNRDWNPGLRTDGHQAPEQSDDRQENRGNLRVPEQVDNRFTHYNNQQVIHQNNQDRDNTGGNVNLNSPAPQPTTSNPYSTRGSNGGRVQNEQRNEEHGSFQRIQNNIQPQEQPRQEQHRQEQPRQEAPQVVAPRPEAESRRIIRTENNQRSDDDNGRSRGREFH